MPSTTRYRRGDIVLVPFPFTDLSSTKKRPALVVSPDKFNEHAQDVVLVAITSQPRVGVAGGGDHRGAGLAVARLVSGRGPGQPEEPGAGCPERRRSSAAGQDRRAADGERVTVREGGPAGGGRPLWPGGGRGDEGRPLDLHASGVRPAADLPGVALRSLQRLRAAAGANVPDAVSAAAGRSARPRTTSWSATFAGCSKRRPFMANGTGRPGRSSGSRESALRRNGCAG